jgi:L,D-transpeptidase catalytic domain/Putative peptidoglycan binding domain
MVRTDARSLLALLALVPVVVPAAAAAQGPPTGRGGISLKWDRQFELRGQDVALQSQMLKLRGTLSQFVPGEAVTVRVNIGPRRIVLARRTVEPAGGGGAFTVDFRVTRAGVVHASALHDASPSLGRLTGESPRLDAFVPVAGRGARGLRVRFLQQRLAYIHYPVGVTGRYDAATGRAVLAYRKVNGLPRVSWASRAVFSRLALLRGGFVARYPSHGRHVEADLGRQVLVLLYPGGAVYRVFPMSSGKPSTPTVVGSYRFYLKTFGINSLGMVHSNYFVGGYAVHGFRSVPTHPASHGCLRIPLSDARFVYRWIRIGEGIDVYYRGRRPPAHQRINPHPGP